MNPDGTSGRFDRTGSGRRSDRMSADGRSGRTRTWGRSGREGTGSPFGRSGARAGSGRKSSVTTSRWNRWTGLGLSLTSAALLLLEVSLTRILSVVMWYHFAFLAISVALFGLAAAGLVVYLRPGMFREERVLGCCWTAAMGLAVAAPVAFALLAANPASRYLRSFSAVGARVATGVLQSAGPFVAVPAGDSVSPSAGHAVSAPAGTALNSAPRSASPFRPGPLAAIALLYLTSTLPFFLGGFVGAVLFRHHGRSSGKLYFLDLAGAGAGCIAAVPLLDAIGGPGAIAAVAALAAAAAAALGKAAHNRRRLALGLVLLVIATGMAVTNSSTGLLHLRYSRGRRTNGFEFEKWNSFSRVTVRQPGSRERPGSNQPDSLLIEIDGASNTWIQRWDGRPERLTGLRDGLIAVPYALTDRPRVCVIGAGGGVDLLTAVAGGARSVTAIEVNPIIVDLMRRRYAGFSGDVYLRPEVTVVTDEARSYFRRSRDRYDIIQAGYVDTYAATAAGAFSLVENALYTRQAYRDYLAHLSPDGIVAIQRYYEDPPQQTVRLVSLALAALAERGDSDPSVHIALVRRGRRASVLVKNSAFTAADVERLAEHCAQAGLELVAAPGRTGPGIYGDLLGASDFHEVIVRYPFDISPVGDDRPFFFYVVKPDRFWRGLLIHEGERMNARAVVVLGTLLVFSLLLCAVLFLAPALGRRNQARRRDLPALGYFAAIGLGFMLLEIGMMQRLMLFLGNPTLALSVVLSTLLISAGLGSAAIGRMGRHFDGGDARSRSGLDGPHGPVSGEADWTDDPRAITRALRLRLIIIMILAVLSALLWPPVFRALVSLERPWRILAAVIALAPAGFFLGMALPLGLRRLALDRSDLIPWAWSVNGGASVLGSVLAMAIAINSGFTATILAGGVCYLIALALAGSAPWLVVSPEAGFHAE